MRKSFNFDYYVSEFDFCNRHEKQNLKNALISAWVWALKH